MDLIKINGYKPPSPTTYKVDFSEIVGANETLESGERYKEQIKSLVPKITLGWVNIPESDCEMIISAVEPTLIDITYYFGRERTAVCQCSSPNLNLKFSKGNERYYDLNMVLEG